MIGGKSDNHHATLGSDLFPVCLSRKDSLENLIVQRMIFLDTNPILLEVVRHNVGVVFDGEGIPHLLGEPHIVPSINRDGFIVVAVLLLSLRGVVTHIVMGFEQLTTVDFQTVVEELDHDLGAVAALPPYPLIVASLAGRVNLLLLKIKVGGVYRGTPGKPPRQAILYLRIANPLDGLRD